MFFECLWSDTLLTPLLFFFTKFDVTLATLRFLSTAHTLCFGIEARSVAWIHLGFFPPVSCTYLLFFQLVFNFTLRGTWIVFSPQSEPSILSYIDMESQAIPELSPRLECSLRYCIIKSEITLRSVRDCHM